MKIFQAPLGVMAPKVENTFSPLNKDVHSKKHIFDKSGHYSKVSFTQNTKNTFHSQISCIRDIKIESFYNSAQNDTIITMKYSIVSLYEIL